MKRIIFFLFVVAAMAFAAQADDLTTSAPVYNGHTVEGIQAYFVEIFECEPDCEIYYRFQYSFPDGEWSDWTEYTGMLAFTEPGFYRMESYAVAPGKFPSETIGYEFRVMEQTLSPTIEAYVYDGNPTYYVKIVESEPSSLYYRVRYPNGNWTEWLEYSDVLSFTASGNYYLETYAEAYGKTPSEIVAYEFVVQERTYAPVYNGHTEEGIQGYFVEIFECEPDCEIYYRFQYSFPDGEWSDWTEYTGMLAFTEPGFYRMESYAVAPGKFPSETIGYEFRVMEQTLSPTIEAYVYDGNPTYYVKIVESEPSYLYYRVRYPNGNWTEWLEYSDVLSFTASGNYYLETYAEAYGKTPSEIVAYEFVVQERTYAPVYNGHTVEGIQAYFVEIFECEPDCEIYYRFQYSFPDGEWSDWTEYTEMLAFTEPGFYRMESYAVAPGKFPSETIGYEFMVVPVTQPGDVNGDGRIDVDDVTELIYILLNSLTPTPGCDVNLDDEYSIDDVTTLISMLLNNP